MSYVLSAPYELKYANVSGGTDYWRRIASDPTGLGHAFFAAWQSFESTQNTTQNHHRWKRVMRRLLLSVEFVIGLLPFALVGSFVAWRRPCLDWETASWNRFVPCSLAIESTRWIAISNSLQSLDVTNDNHVVYQSWQCQFDRYMKTAE